MRPLKNGMPGAAFKFPNTQMCCSWTLPINNENSCITHGLVVPVLTRKGVDPIILQSIAQNSGFLSTRCPYVLTEALIPHRGDPPVRSPSPQDLCVVHDSCGKWQSFCGWHLVCVAYHCTSIFPARPGCGPGLLGLSYRVDYSWPPDRYMCQFSVYTPLLKGLCTSSNCHLVVNMTQKHVPLWVVCVQ